MSWIKDNKFMVALGGGTLVGAALLYYMGAEQITAYDQAKADFDAAQGEAARYEKTALYPKAENEAGKRKALAEYRQATESIQSAFNAYRSKDLTNVSPQDFTNSVKSANEEIVKAAAASGTKLPEAFFCGFESYKSALARGNSTGILSYELDGIKTLMLELTKSGATELKNLYRQPLIEEEGQVYNALGPDVARKMPLEITFSGKEDSMRKFLSSISKKTDQYFVIRSIAVHNQKKEAPKVSDAKFDKPAASTTPSNDLFGGGFVLPGETPATPAAENKEAAPPPTADSSRILSQVLGNEEIQVFLRLDYMQFLPAKKLP
ncbi:MAG: hypothetical protein H8M99_13015 [Gloeobacteraceae cyanobacterium ES-bin-144]|nr:hypothetical protein [Verrucomicrobiales bacterium]